METSWIFLALISCTLAYPNLVPNSAEICKSMTPNHGLNALKTVAPCQVLPNRNSVKGGRHLLVVISATDSADIKGFYLQARNEKDGPIGTFSSTKDVKTHHCNGFKDNAAHHARNEPKRVISAFWKAPTHYNGTVIFTATCVKDFEHFWTKVKSEPVHVSEKLSKNRTKHSPPSSSLLTTGSRATVSKTYSRQRRFGNSYIMGSGRLPRILTGIKYFKNTNQPTTTNANTTYIHHDPNHNYYNQNQVLQSDESSIENNIVRNNDTHTISQIFPTSSNHYEYDARITSSSNTNTSPSNSNPISIANNTNPTYNKQQDLTKNSFNGNTNDNFHYYYVTPNSHEFYSEQYHPPQSQLQTTFPSQHIQRPEPIQLISPKIESFKLNKNKEPVTKIDKEYGHFSPRPVVPPPLHHPTSAKPTTTTSNSAFPSPSNCNLNANTNLESVYPIHIIAHHHQLAQSENQRKNHPTSIRDKIHGQQQGVHQLNHEHNNHHHNQPNNPFQFQYSHHNINSNANGNGPLSSVDTGNGFNSFSPLDREVGFGTGVGAGAGAGLSESKFVHPKMESGFRPNIFRIPLNKLKLRLNEFPYAFNNNNPNVKSKLDKPTKSISIRGSGSNSIINPQNFPMQGSLPLYQFYPSDSNNHKKEGNVVGFGAAENGNGPLVPSHSHADGHFNSNDGINYNGFGFGGGHGHGHGRGIEFGPAGIIGGDGNSEGVHLPRYGYLVYNQKRGPPFYIIPEQELPYQLSNLGQELPQSHSHPHPRLFHKEREHGKQQNIEDDIYQNRIIKPRKASVTNNDDSD